MTKKAATAKNALLQAMLKRMSSTKVSKIPKVGNFLKIKLISKLKNIK